MARRRQKLLQLVSLLACSQLPVTKLEWTASKHVILGIRPVSFILTSL